MCVVVGAIIVLHMVSWSWWLALEGEDSCTSISKGGGESMVTRPQKRKSVEKRKKKKYKQGVSQHKEHGDVADVYRCRNMARWGA